MPSGHWTSEYFKDVLAAIGRPIYSGAGCIVSLHRVVLPAQLSKLRANRALEVTPQALRAILAWVRRRGLEVIRIDEVRNRLASPRGAKFICFTLNDGYRDSLFEALPIFREFSFPVTVNVANAFINRTASVWWYTLEDLVTRQTSVRLKWDGSEREWPLTSETERESAFADLASLIRAQGMSTRDSLIAALCESAGIDPLARTHSLMLDWDDLGKLAADWYVTIGSHTMGHHVLSRLTDEELEGELIDSKAELEARLGKPVQHLAYPFGDRDAVGRREFDLARECDFLTAVTNRSGNLFEEHAWHLQALPRLAIDGNQPELSMLRRAESGFIPERPNRWRRVVVE